MRQKKSEKGDCSEEGRRVRANKYNNIETETERRTAAAPTPNPTQQLPATSHHHLLLRRSSRPAAAGAGAVEDRLNPGRDPGSGASREARLGGAPRQLQQRVEPDGSSSTTTSRARSLPPRPLPRPRAQQKQR